MSDLSNLLGDVYGGPSSDEAPARREPVAPERDFERAPDWSSQSRLDQAFDGWVPGEPPAGGEQRAETLAVDAPRLAAPAPARPEFQAPAPVVPAPVAPMPPRAAVAPSPSAPRPAWTAAPSAPLAEMSVVAPAPVRSWLIGDDDILPAGKKAKRKN